MIDPFVGQVAFRCSQGSCAVRIFRRRKSGLTVILGGCDVVSICSQTLAFFLSSIRRQ